MKILVAGASGFVGNHLVNFLKTKGVQVTGTYWRHRPDRNLAAQYFPCNFLDRKAVIRLFRKVKPTHVVHLIGQSSPSLSWQIPYETIQGNVFTTINLLDACRVLNLKPKILHISSAHVYGKTFLEKKIVSETDLPKPMDPYATSKIQGEYFALQYWYQFQIPSVIIRAAAHIGVGQPPFFVISNFTKQIAEIEKKKRPPILRVGNLNVERSFVAVQDMVNAYWLALKKGKPGEIYNIGGSHLKPMGEWLAHLLKLTETKISPKLDPARKRLKEPLRIMVDSRKFRKATGWRETIPVSETFQSVLDWWRVHA